MAFIQRRWRMASGYSLSLRAGILLKRKQSLIKPGIADKEEGHTLNYQDQPCLACFDWCRVTEIILKIIAHNAISQHFFRSIDISGMKYCLLMHTHQDKSHQKITRKRQIMARSIATVHPSVPRFQITPLQNIVPRRFCNRVNVVPGVVIRGLFATL